MQATRKRYDFRDLMTALLKVAHCLRLILSGEAIRLLEARLSALIWQVLLGA